MQEVYEFLKACGTYYLATVEGDQPRVRPFGTIDIFEDKLYIQTGKVKDVSKEMQANPKVEICAFNGQQWIRVAGEVVRDDRVEAKKHMLDSYPNLQALYRADDDNTEVLYLKNATATISSFTEEPRYNKVDKYALITFRICVYHEFNIEPTTGIARHDLIGSIIRERFNWSNIFGRQCKLVSDKPGASDTNYVTRTLTFQVVSTNGIYQTDKNGVTSTINYRLRK